MRKTFKTIEEFNEAIDWFEQNAIRFEAYCDPNNPSKCWVDNICLKGELTVNTKDYILSMKALERGNESPNRRP